LKNLILIAFTILSFAFKAYGQKEPECAVNIGGNYYINCKHIILFKEQDILSISNSKGDTIGVNFDVFSIDGKKVAEVESGRLLEGDKSLYSIKTTPSEFSFIEIATKRIICFVKKVSDNEKYDCVYEVYVDMNMPDGSNFQCTTETTNNPMLNLMQGNVFRNSLSAIILE
jgi:hypothetical protein